MTSELLELLRAFKSTEQNEDAIPVLGDEDAMKTLAAWQKTDPSWSAPTKKWPTLTPTNHNEVWSWILMGWRFDVNKIAAGSGLTTSTVQRKLDMLTRARLIYPDGALAKGARAALQVHIAKKLGVRPPKRDESTTKKGEGN